MKIFAILALLLLGWLGFEIIREVLRLYGIASADIKLGVMTASGSALAFVVNNAIQSSRERRARLFENKRAAYNEFFEFFFSIFTQQKAGTPLDDKQLEKSFSNFTRNVMTWGSAATVNAVLEYQRSSLQVEPDNTKSMFGPTEKLLRALRKDLGHSDSPLEKSALTKLILKADEHHKLD